MLYHQHTVSRQNTSTQNGFNLSSSTFSDKNSSCKFIEVKSLFLYLIFEARTNGPQIFSYRFQEEDMKISVTFRVRSNYNYVYM